MEGSVSVHLSVRGYEPYSASNMDVITIIMEIPLVVTEDVVFKQCNTFAHSKLNLCCLTYTSIQHLFVAVYSIRTLVLTVDSAFKKGDK